MNSEIETVRDDVARRLARVAGHASSLKRMWDEGRDIDDLLMQIAAVRAALDQIGRAMLELHIDQSLTQAIQKGDSTEAARDLKNALDRFIS
jgi:CsoR family transcriptional regulator, copper-sensing transcriptional repressor